MFLNSYFAKTVTIYFVNSMFIPFLGSINEERPRLSAGFALITGVLLKVLYLLVQLFLMCILLVNMDLLYLLLIQNGR